MVITGTTYFAWHRELQELGKAKLGLGLASPRVTTVIGADSAAYK